MTIFYYVIDIEVHADDADATAADDDDDEDYYFKDTLHVLLFKKTTQFHFF